MNRRLLILFSIILLMIVTACSNSLPYDFDKNGKNIVTLKGEDNQFESTITYTANGDKVEQQTAENKVDYEMLNLGSKKQAEFLFEESTEELNSHEGINVEVEFFDDYYIERLTIDFDQVDLEEIDKLPGLNIDGNIKEGVSLKASVKLLLDNGYEVVK